jgi:integrase
VWLFDEWAKIQKGGPVESRVRYGTVDWLFQHYKASIRFEEKVSARSRPDYERSMLMVADMLTTKGERVGNQSVRSVSPAAADKIYDRLCRGPHGPRLRQAEKVVVICRAAWRVVHRLRPDAFDRDLPNPWVGVTKKRRTKLIKPAVTREEVYRFASGAIEAGHPEAAAAAVICFEFLQRPENVLAGYLAWPDYRSKDAPTAIRIVHHKTGATVWHPLEELTEAGTVQFYADAESVLGCLPRRGVPMILKPKRDGTAEPYAPREMQKLTKRLRGKLGLPSTFTLDACRHGGMTELEEAELTDGQGRALSGHRTHTAYAGYAKRSLARALPATRKRYAHMLANVQVHPFRMSR